MPIEDGDGALALVRFCPDIFRVRDGVRATGRGRHGGDKSIKTWPVEMAAQKFEAFTLVVEKDAFEIERVADVIFVLF